MSHPQSYSAYAFTQKNGPLEKVTLPWKDPKENQVVIKVLGCGVCHRYVSSFVFSYFFFNLCAPSSSDAGVQKERFSVKLPRVPGHEIVGEIVVLGPGETHFKIGQRVGGGWHGGHCGRCKNCRVGDFTTCELQAINGMPQAAAFYTPFIIRMYTSQVSPSTADMQSMPHSGLRPWSLYLMIWTRPKLLLSCAQVSRLLVRTISWLVVTGPF